MRLTLLTLLLALFPTFSLAQQTPAAATTTLEELHRLVDDRQFSPALQKITASLALKGAAAKMVNRYELFMLKGECHLQTKAIRLATESYASAAKEATSDHDRLIARAHEMLVKTSRAFAYTPRPTTGKTRPAPIDILDRASRRKAFAAMLADELTANDARIQTARTSGALPPIAQLFTPLATMEGLELAATGDDKQVKALRTELTDAAKKAVAAALRTLSNRVSQIDKSANAFVETYQEGIDALGRPAMVRMYKKKGLTDPETRELSDTNATCDKISPALSELAKGLGAEDKTFEPFTEEAARIRREVDRILDTDYLQTYRQLPK
jgi:hypothetical protein